MAPNSSHPTELQPALRRELGLWDLVLLNIAAIVGVRWISDAAHAGPGTFLLWIFAAAFFFLPCVFAVSSLSRRFPEEGGLYIWSKAAFGEWHGFLCAWFYTFSNLVYFPTVLLAGVTMSSYVFGPSAAKALESPALTIPITLGALWLTFAANLVGLKAGKWASNFGGASTYVIVALLIVFAVWIGAKDGLATKLYFLPKVNFENLNIWSQIAFSFIGLELGAILGGEIKDPRRTIPRAAWISGFTSVVFYIAGTFALLALMPPESISVLTGLAQAGQVSGARLGIAWLPAAFALLIGIGIFGQAASYVAGVSRLPYAIGLDRHMPPIFAKLHPRWRTPYVTILTECAIATVFLLALQTGERDLQAAYQILVDMCTITGFLPFLYIFGSAWHFGQKLAGASGFSVSLAAILLSLSPPDNLSSIWMFEAKLIGGCVLITWLGWLIFRKSNTAAAREL